MLKWREIKMKKTIKDEKEKNNNEKNLGEKANNVQK